MKIWIIEIGEPLPVEQNVRLHRYGIFSQYLAQHGHDVTWWTSSYSHAPKKNFFTKDTECVVEGVTLKVIYGKGYKKNISFSRILHQKRFAKKFLNQAKREPIPDIILAPVPTIDGALAAVLFGLDKKVPVVVDIRDLWPDELVNLLPAGLRWLGRIILFNSFRKMKFVCSNATAIFGVSKTYRDYGIKFAGRLPLVHDIIFPFTYPTKKISEQSPISNIDFWRHYNFKDTDFICCFFGTVGKFFNIDTIIAAAKQLPPAVKFVICGDGSRLNYYRKKSTGIDNVIFPGWVKAPEIFKLMEISSVGLAPYAANAKMSMPNKPIEYLAGGLPIISSIQYELKELLHDYQCGITYNADKVDEFVTAISQLYNDKNLQIKMSVNARNLFADKFLEEKVFSECEFALGKIVSQIA